MLASSLPAREGVVQPVAVLDQAVAADRPLADLAGAAAGRPLTQPARSAVQVGVDGVNAAGPSFVG